MKFAILPSLVIKKPLTFLTICIFFNLISCQKDHFSGNKIDDGIVSHLQTWLKNKQEKGSPKEKLSIDTLLLQAKWAKGEHAIASDGKILIFVPTLSESIGLEFFYDPFRKTIDSCNIIKAYSNSVTHSGFSLNAIRAYYENVIVKHSLQNGISGNIQTFSISSNYLYTYTFSNGKIVSRGFLSTVPDKLAIKTNSVNKNNFNGTKKSGYTCELWGHFTEWTDGNVTLDYTYYVCSCDVATGINLKTGEIAIRTNCASDQGGSAENSLKDITIKITDRCLKQIVEGLLNQKFNNSITSILKNIFSVNNKINLTFAQDPLLTSTNTGTPVQGTTSGPSAFGADGSLNLTITINPTLIANTTQEYRASIIIHEIVHASLRYSNAGPDQAQGLFTGTLQHMAMLESYMDIMSEALVDLYGMSKLKALSLSFGGLGNQVIGTNTFKSFLSKWGFNENPSSSDFWAYHLVNYQQNTNYGTWCTSSSSSSEGPNGTSN